MYAEIGLKLRLTAMALRCGSRKELCARFRNVNANTHCDLERLHKWVQGRALPRSPQLFDDWAKLIGTTRSATWIATCQIGPFMCELAERSGIPLDDLRSIKSQHQSAAVGEQRGELGTVRTLHGAFACYSQPWSPHFRGRLLRSSLAIRSCRQTLRATYAENVAGRELRMEGIVTVIGRILYTVLNDPFSGLPMFFTMHLPDPHASVLCGVISGAAFLSHAPLPSSSRMLAVRVPQHTDLDASNCFVDWTPSAISQDLLALGVPFDASMPIDHLVGQFFDARVDQITPAEQLALSRAFDRVHPNAR